MLICIFMLKLFSMHKYGIDIQVNGVIVLAYPAAIQLETTSVSQPTKFRLAERPPSPSCTVYQCRIQPPGVLLNVCTSVTPVPTSVMCSRQITNIVQPRCSALCIRLFNKKYMFAQKSINDPKKDHFLDFGPAYQNTEKFEY